MYKTNKANKTTLKTNTSYVGESIETKVERITSNKEPIHDGAPLIYTDRKNGIEPQYDIRTDRFEIAIDATDKITKTQTAQREERLGERTYDTMTPEQQAEFKTKFPKNKLSIGKPESTQDT